MNYTLTQKVAIKKVIELLNKMGYTIVDINDEFYASNEFEPQNPDAGIYEHMMYGRDITTMIEHSVDHVNIDTHRQREITTMIGNMAQVRRRFHNDIKYVVYAAHL